MKLTKVQKRLRKAYMQGVTDVISGITVATGFALMFVYGFFR